MNQTIKDLEERRSIRKYKDEQIKDEDLQQILEAGEYAPSGMGRQSAIMVAIQNKKVINRLSKINAKIMGVDTDPFYGAPTVVVVLADKNVPTYIEDGSLVMGNLLNAAHSLNIGSCWIHRAKETFETEEGKELLKEWNIDDKYVGIGNCILGYVEGDYPQPKERKKDYIKFIK